MTIPASNPQPAAQAEKHVTDPGNPFISEVPAILATEVRNSAAGQFLAHTVRIPNATLTVLLRKDDVLKWADQLRADHAKMNGLIIP